MLAQSGIMHAAQSAYLYRLWEPQALTQPARPALVLPVASECPMLYSKQFWPVYGCYGTGSCVLVRGSEACRNSDPLRGACVGIGGRAVHACAASACC